MPDWTQPPQDLSDHAWALFAYAVPCLALAWFAWVSIETFEWWVSVLCALAALVFFFLALDALGDVIGCIFRVGCFIPRLSRY